MVTIDYNPTMGEQPAESDALRTWFKRQRRDWWRVNWWKWAVVVLVIFAVVYAVPHLQAGLVAWQMGMSYSQILPQMSANYWTSLPLGYLVMVLFSAWQVARLGSSYQLPTELLVASTPKDCTRAYQHVFRWDVYLVFGLLLVLLELLYLRVVLASRVSLGPAASYMCYLALAQFSTSEITVVLHSIKRNMQHFTYFIVPAVLLILGIVAPAAVIFILEKLTGLSLESQGGLISCIWGIVVLVLAIGLGRIHLVRNAMNSGWVEE